MTDTRADRHRLVKNVYLRTTVGYEIVVVSVPQIQRRVPANRGEGLALDRCVATLPALSDAAPRVLLANPAAPSSPLHQPEDLAAEHRGAFTARPAQRPSSVCLL